MIHTNISFPSIKTIIFFEIKRYFKEFQFNIIGPLITTILFIVILNTIDKYYNFNSISESYISFLIPGIIMSITMQTSFSHLSEVIISRKQIGSFDDYLISPISRVEIFLALLSSSLFVCFVVAFINLFFLSFFVFFIYIDFITLIYYLFICIIIFSSLGAITGFLSYTWDIQSSVLNFLIMPISFFSGTYFPLNSVDVKFKYLFELNPFFYIVSGFRKSFTSNVYFNIYSEIYIISFLFFIFFLSIFIFNKGYKVIN